MPKSYITDHHGGGYQFQIAVPLDLRAFIGKKVIYHYIKRKPRREAEDDASKLAADYKYQFDLCRACPQQVRDDIASYGGLYPFRERSAKTPTQPLVEAMVEKLLKDSKERLGPLPDDLRNDYDAITARISANPNPIFADLDYWLPFYPVLPHMIEVAKQKKVDWVWSTYENQKPSSKALTSWDSLFEAWKKKKEPAVTRGHALTIRLLKAFFGDKDVRNITAPDVADFRDHLVKAGKSRVVVTEHLGRLRGMFSGAMADPRNPFHGGENPAKNVTMDGKAPKDNRKKDFTPAQVKLILETAARVKFGGPTHEDFMWMLRLLAFTGARPNEISMLQGADIVWDEETGIKFIHIRDTDAVTGEKHPEKSIKTGEVRRVPLHPAVEDFFDYAQTFDKDAFIFGRFTYHKTGKRAHPLISVFGSFLREDCGIQKDPTKRLVLYSFRHRFETVLREAQVFEDIRTALMGHGKDIPAGYGSWPLPTLYDAVKKTKPMG